MSCGECGECCVRFDIPELNKAAGKTCRHFNSGAGCTIYDDRPNTCRAYRCYWLLTQEDDRFKKMRSDMRPDKIGVVFEFKPSPEGQIIVLTVDPARPEMINDDRVSSFAKELRMRTGFPIVGVCGKDRVTILPRMEIVQS